MNGSLPEPVRSLDARITSALKEGTEAAMDTLTSYMAEASGPESVRLIVSAVCADAYLANRCFRSSLAHPLGFDKFLLHACEAYDLRLHVWWPDSDRRREDIHNHRFSLFSGIITGELRVSTHEICEHGTIMRFFEEFHDGTGRAYDYLAHGSVGVRQTGLVKLGRGNAYYLHSNVLHQVAAASGSITATLFIRVPEPLGTSRILRGVGEPDPQAGIRAKLGGPEAERRIRSFLETLD